MRYSLLLLTLALFFPVNAQAQWAGDCVVGDVAALQGIVCLVEQVLSVALRLLGLGLLVMLVVGGLKMLTSGGNPKSIESGKQTLTLAITGVALAIGAWFLLVLIQTVTGVPVTTFIFNSTQ